MRRENLVGQIFGRLTVTQAAGVRDGRAYWDCTCKCGNTRRVRADALRSGRCISCGCAHKYEQAEKAEVKPEPPKPKWVGAENAARDLASLW